MSEPTASHPESAIDLRAARTARFDAARRDLAAATMRGEGGRLAHRQYSQRMDAIVQQLFAAAGPVTSSVGIFALGGYGRKELCLHSDIDLLILFAGPIANVDERFLHAFLNPLWDLGLTIGHHVREVSDGSALESDNAEFLLALTDARPVVGDATLLDQFTDATDGARTAARTLDALRALIAARHARFNDTLYQLEPDVKESPGGLRDLFAAQTIARLTDPTLLSQAGPGTQALDDAEEFMLRVRAILHLESKRHQNVLSHELQECAATCLGYPGASDRQRVECLMSDYFRHARAIERALRWALRAGPTPVGPNRVRAADGVRFVDAREAAARPESWLGLFQAALDCGCAVTDDALMLVQQYAGQYPVDRFLPTPAHRAALRTFLRPRTGLYARLCEMHEAGLLGQILPEFKAINCRVVRDFYHKYTVDEHTLLTIRNLERLVETGPERGRFARLLAELAAPELLVIALLYHDVGKGSDADDHAAESERMLGLLADRLELNDEDRALVQFLVGQHLKMSLVAFRRDTEDPGIVAQFAQLVGDANRLKMLSLLTLADVAAVSPDTLTPWKEELLWRLYVDTYNHLTVAYGDEVIDSTQAAVADVVAARPDDLSAADVEGFLKGLPRRYLQLFSRDAIYSHVRRSRTLGSGGVATWLERKDQEWALTVITHDQPYLFSKLSGVLSLYGMDILRGYAFTKPDDRIVDTFHFSDQERFLELNAGGDAELVRSVEGAVAGQIDVAARLRGREEGALRRRLPGFAPVVHCDNDSSPRYTIVEIVAENARGLLYRMSRVMSESGCDVDLVLISTEGQSAIDVFHLTCGGQKLSRPQHEALTANLQRVLEGQS
jgi:[protein-PII] uridylyltransferase